MTTKAQIDAAMLSIYADGPTKMQGLIMVDPWVFAVTKAANDFYGRDRRRVKREMRKAGDIVKRRERGKPKGIDSSANSFWRVKSLRP